MVYIPRWYQEEGADAIAQSVEEPEINPVCVMPTGSGKTYTICESINRILTRDPLANVVITSHVSEILEQNHNSMSGFFEGIPIGLYSAGLKSRTINQITVAGIQSIHRKPEFFDQKRTYILVDECHLVPDDNKSMYRKFLNSLENCSNIAGLTATPFRTKSGYIYKGPGRIFNKVCYDLSSFENYNRLVDEGFLSPLVGKNTHVRLRAEKEKIRTTGGDWNLKDLSTAFDRDAITDAAINEVLHFGKDRNLWLIFAIDIQHAENIVDNLRKKGIKTACVHSQMKGDRGKTTQEIKNGEYRAVVNVDVLTTGFDAPNVDMLVFLRNTKSPGNHVQMMGRGARPVYADGYDLNEISGRLSAMESGPKQDCLVLDFAGNMERLGPINDPLVKEPDNKKKDGGLPIMKECPECMGLNYGFAKYCFNCDHEFIFKEKIKTTASNAEAMKRSKKAWFDVSEVSYSIHQKKGTPSSLRVIYKTGLTSFSEWICYGRKGYAGHIARNWVRTRWPDRNNLPDNLNELFANSRLLKKPTKIFVDNSKKFPDIQKFEFG